jgi:hypothetical protein
MRPIRGDVPTLAHVKAVSETYGVDTKRDGTFDLLLPPAGQPRPGMKVAADDGNGERRCAFVFDLAGIAMPNVAWILPTLLHTYPADYHGGDDFVTGGSYELHGFSGGPSVTPDDLVHSNLLAGPTASASQFHVIDVGTFVKSQLANGARYVGFSVRNVATQGRVTFHTGLTALTLYYEVPWALSPHEVPRLVVEIKSPDPWGLPLVDVPRLVAEIQPPEPWALPLPNVPRLVVELRAGAEPWELPLSDVPRLVAEAPSTSAVNRSETPPEAQGFPIRQILNAAMIGQIAATMTGEEARAIQKQALEMISKIAAAEIRRLDHGQ